MLGKKESCDAGTIESPKATVVTYVEQDPEFPEGSTVKDAVFGADNPLMRCVCAWARVVVSKASIETNAPVKYPPGQHTLCGILATFAASTRDDMQKGMYVV